MKKGTSKHTANSDNFNELQSLRSGIKDYFTVENVKWGGHWNGMNWSNFSFYCTKETLKALESFCKEVGLNISFN